MNKISNGDIVKLIGLVDSPEMKVLGTQTGSITCYWFDVSKRIHTFRFPEKALTQVGSFKPLKQSEYYQSPKEDSINNHNMITYKSSCGVIIKLDAAKYPSYWVDFKVAVLMNEKIQAIKHLRTMTGLGLRESKDDYEQYCDKWKAAFNAK